MTEAEQTVKDKIVSLDTKSLWAIVRSTSAMTERFANELTWAKAELSRRGGTTCIHCGKPDTTIACGVGGCPLGADL